MMVLPTAAAPSDAPTVALASTPASTKVVLQAAKRAVAPFKSQAIAPTVIPAFASVVAQAPVLVTQLCKTANCECKAKVADACIAESPLKREQRHAVVVCKREADAATAVRKLKYDHSMKVRRLDTLEANNERNKAATK